MNVKIEPYQYMKIIDVVDQLIHSYQSVNDIKTIEAVQSITVEKIYQTLPEISKEELEDLITVILDRQLTRESVEKYFETFKAFVIPFSEPSEKQIEKVFRKVKKLKFPDFKNLDLREYTYIGWNDSGTQKKFLLYYQEEKLAGMYGELSTKIVKGFCSICHHESNVAMFTATTKKASEGRYTKKGNYICVDSERCNRHLQAREDLDAFLEKTK